MRKLYLALALAGAAAATPTLAQPYFLVAQWYEGNNHLCKYANGTVLNVGIKFCPFKIEG